MSPPSVGFDSGGCGPAQGFFLDTAQVAGEILLESLLDQADRHTGFALHGEFVEKPAAARIAADAPDPFETAEIALQHPEAEAPLIPEFGEFKLHPG